MPTWTDWPLPGAFLAASLLLVLTPGPAVLYIVARSLQQGRRAGLVSVLGVAVGSLAHVAAAALGLSALLVSSALALLLVKYAGALYLIYLGIRTLLAREPAAAATRVAPATLRQVFWQGVLVNLLNPKTALFFFAFLPQFAEPIRGSVGGQMVLLGSSFVVIALCSDSIYALLAGLVRAWLLRSAHCRRALRFVSGSIYLALGSAAACGSAEHL